MAKAQHNIKLHGVTKDGTKAKTSDVGKVVAFVNDKNSIRVTHSKDGNVTIKTTEGSYILTKHATKNMYSGVLAKGIKAHFICKKIVATLIYWA